MEPHLEGFKAWEGQIFLGCRRKSANIWKDIVNNCMYKVVAVDSAHLTVQLMAEGEAEENQPKIKLTHHDAVQYLRLSCARVYASVQGLTLRDQHLLLLNLHSPYMTARALYVGLSRATAGANVHIPSENQWRDLCEGRVR